MFLICLDASSQTGFSYVDRNFNQIGAESMSMAGACTAHSSGANSTYWNPAFLTDLSKIEFRIGLKETFGFFIDSVSNPQKYYEKTISHPFQKPGIH